MSMMGLRRCLDLILLASLAAAPAAATPAGAPAPLRGLAVVDPTAGGCSYASGTGLSVFAYRGHTIYAYDCYSIAGHELTFFATIDTPVKCSPTNPTCTSVSASAIVVSSLGDTATHELRQTTATVTTGGHTYLLDLGPGGFSSTSFAGLVRDYADAVLGRALTFNPASVGSIGRFPSVDGEALVNNENIPVDFTTSAGTEFHGALSLTESGAEVEVRLDGVWNQPTDRVTIAARGAIERAVPGDGTCRVDIGGLVYEAIGEGASDTVQYPAALRLGATATDCYSTDKDILELVGATSEDFVRFMLTHTIHLARAAH